MTAVVTKLSNPYCRKNSLKARCVGQFRDDSIACSNEAGRCCRHEIVQRILPPSSEGKARCVRQFRDDGIACLLHRGKQCCRREIVQSMLHCLQLLRQSGLGNVVTTTLLASQAVLSSRICLRYRAFKLLKQKWIGQFRDDSVACFIEASSVVITKLSNASRV